MEMLHGLDVLLIPVGGFFSIDGREAASLVKELRPRITIPMHYRSIEHGFGFDVLGTVDDFLSYFPDEIERLDRSSIDTDDSHKAIVVLNPLNMINK